MAALRRRRNASPAAPLFLLPLGAQLMLSAAAAASSSGSISDSRQDSRHIQTRSTADQSTGSQLHTLQRRSTSQAQGSTQRGFEKRLVKPGSAAQEAQWVQAQDDVAAADIIQAVILQADGSGSSNPGPLDVSPLPGQSAEWMGMQSGSGYVFARRSELKHTLFARSAFSKIFPHRDPNLSYPPLVPNSSSRLIIQLVFICIFSVAILTFLVQEIWRRRQANSPSSSPRRRRRSSDSYFHQRHGRSSASHRSAAGAGSSTTPDVALMSMEEEEETILTPPAISRRGSTWSTQDGDGSDSDDHHHHHHHHHHKEGSDLHYYALPFGFGVGYSYGPLNRNTAARAMDAQSPELARSSSSSLPFSSTSALRSRGTAPATDEIETTNSARERDESFTLLDLGEPSPARHPLVEHLRREGRTDAERRVGKGTPISKHPY